MSSSITNILACVTTMSDRMNPGFISVAAETLIAYGSIMNNAQCQLSVDTVVNALCETNTECLQTWPALATQGKVKTEPCSPSTKVKATSEGGVHTSRGEGESHAAVGSGRVRVKKRE